VGKRVATLGEKHGVETRCQLVKKEEETSGDIWLDAYGHQLGAKAGGPPTGYNIVFTLAQDIAWPPKRSGGATLVLKKSTK
jgi:hypothetical protein